MKHIIFSFLIFSLMISACKTKDRDVSSPIDVSHTMRPDTKAPVIVSILPGAYVDESLGEWVDFNIRRQRNHDEKVEFKKYVTNWRMDPAQSQWALERERKRLPYFVITIEDEDTSVDNLSVSYDVSFGDDQEGEASHRRHFRSADKYAFGRSNQWAVILSEQTVGEFLTTFTGEKEFILHIKASDGGNNKTVGEFRFTIHNLKPEVNIYTAWDYMDSEGYPLRDRTVFWGEHQDTYLEQLRSTGIPFSEGIVFSKVMIENKNRYGMYLKVSYDGTLEYEFQKWYQEWKEDRFAHTLLYSQKWGNAPVVTEVMEWRGNHELKPQSCVQLYGLLDGIYYIPPFDPSLEDEGRLALILLFITRFDFLRRHSAIEFNNSLNPNLFIDILKNEGYLKIYTAPHGLPEDFYHLESNWRDLSSPYSRVLKIVSQ